MTPPLLAISVGSIESIPCSFACEGQEKSRKSALPFFGEAMNWAAMQRLDLQS